MSRNGDETGLEAPSAECFRKNSIEGELNMPFIDFRNRVGAIAHKAGVSVVFFHEDGKHIARCSDGVTITGNTLSRNVSIRWGSGHSAMTEI